MFPYRYCHKDSDLMLQEVRGLGLSGKLPGTKCRSCSSSGYTDFIRMMEKGCYGLLSFRRKILLMKEYIHFISTSVFVTDKSLQYSRHDIGYFAELLVFAFYKCNYRDKEKQINSPKVTYQ